MQKDKTEFKVRKPSFLLYAVAARIIGFFAKLYWRIRIDKSATKDLKGPFFAIAPHMSTLDIIPTLLALLPHRANIVAAKDVFTWKELKPFIRAFGAIPMNQMGNDYRGVKLIMSAIEKGLNVVLFPEGKSSLDGRQAYYLNPTVAKLAKMLDCPVVLVKSHGAFLSKPRFANGFRRGRIETKTDILFTQAELRALEPDAIFARIEAAFETNDNVWQQANAVEFKAKELASRLNYILYKCPKCGAEYQMSASRDRLVCATCGNAVTYTSTGHLVADEGSETFDRIDQWVDFEKESVFNELKDPDFALRAPVALSRRDDAKFKFADVGEGELYLNRDAIGFDGVKSGEAWHCELPIARMPSIITKNDEGIDLQIKSTTYRFMFKEGKLSMKYMLYIENMFAMRNGIKYF